MTCSELIVWFANRKIGPIHRRVIGSELGNVRHELAHLVQLGLLTHYYDFRAKDFVYYLRRHATYQKYRRAA